MTDTKIEAKEPTQAPVLGKRTPLYAQKGTTGVKVKPGFHRHLVVEMPGRVEKFLAAGYTMVEDKEQDARDKRLQNTKNLGTTYRPVVNRMLDAPSKTAVWMEIPIELYEADQRAKMKQLDEVDASINPKKFQERDPDQFYTATFKDEYKRLEVDN